MGTYQLHLAASWSGQIIPNLNVYVLSSPVTRIEVRAMYGGLQMAIGIFALIGAIRPKHRESVLLFFMLALTGLALCRFGGMVADHDSSYLSFGTIAPGKYNQVGLAMYELPNMIFVWALFLLRPRAAKKSSVARRARAEMTPELAAPPSTLPAPHELAALRNELAALRIVSRLPRSIEVPRSRRH